MSPPCPFLLFVLSPPTTGSLLTPCPLPYLVSYHRRRKAKRAAAERAVRHLRNGAVSKAWTRWVAFMVETWRMQELMEKAVGRWDNRLCSAAFARWKEV